MASRCNFVCELRKSACGRAEQRAAGQGRGRLTISGIIEDTPDLPDVGQIRGMMPSSQAVWSAGPQRIELLQSRLFQLARRQFGKVDIPQEAFIAAPKVDS